MLYEIKYKQSQALQMLKWLSSNSSYYSITILATNLIDPTRFDDEGDPIFASLQPTNTYEVSSLLNASTKLREALAIPKDDYVIRGLDRVYAYQLPTPVIYKRTRSAFSDSTTE